MLSLEEYSLRDAVGLTHLIRDGEVTAAEVEQTAVDAARVTGPALDAFTEGPFDAAQPANRFGELAGVPFVVKDLLIAAAGVPGHGGSAALADGAPPEADSILMSRFREAGLGLIGSTKAAEFGLSVTTDQNWRGPVRNPWDTTRGPGGSSGGSAALVAAGVVPVAHANDGAGSIRIPAAHCGLVGLKPSRGRIPLGPGQQELMYGNAVEFALTRTIRDTAYLLDLVHGNAPGEKYGAPPPARPYRAEVTDPAPRPLRIAVATHGWGGEPLEPEVRSAVEHVARVLAELGHSVDEATPPIDWDGVLSALTTTWCAGTAAAVLPLFAAGVERELLEATTVTCAEAGKKVGPAELAVAFDRNNTLCRIMGNFHLEWDVWLTPTSVGSAPPLLVDDGKMANYSAEDWVRRCVTPYPACALLNVTGGPAVSLPLAETSGGLPLGLQLSTDIYREDVLVRTAAQLECAMPWSSRRPDVHATTARSA